MILEVEREGTWLSPSSIKLILSLTWINTDRFIADACFWCTQLAPEVADHDVGQCIWNNRSSCHASMMHSRET